MIITLCGSTRFKKEFEEMNAKLTMNGWIVLSCGVFGHADGIELSEEQKELLDKLHMAKIDMSDAILIINKDDYIGASTNKEIQYALLKDKKIFFAYGSTNILQF